MCGSDLGAVFVLAQPRVTRRGKEGAGSPRPGAAVLCCGLATAWSPRSVRSSAGLPTGDGAAHGRRGLLGALEGECSPPAEVPKLPQGFQAELSGGSKT